MNEHSPTRLSRFLLAWAVIFGALARLVPVLASGMPVNDGGLFYSMSRDIQAANFALPAFTTYNQAGIPFAYPPLGLYLAAFGGLLFPLAQVIRWLPPLVSILTIPAFFALARAMLDSDARAGIAAAAYALLPASYELVIMGGGLTRAFGLLFSILTLLNAWQLFRRPTVRRMLLTALTAGLLLLSHPMIAIHTALGVLLFWLFSERRRQSVLPALGVAGLALLFTAPWWGTVLARHGAAPFLNAAHTGGSWLTVFVPLLFLDFGHELFLELILLLAALGTLWLIARRRYLIPLWTLALFLVGRNAFLDAAVPAGLAASFGVADVLWGGFRAPKEIRPKETLKVFETFRVSGGAFSRGQKILAAFLLIYATFGALAYSLTINLHVTPAERDALAWIAEHTPPEARFLLLTHGSALNTPVQEWFPALTGRINIGVVQGYEWLPGRQFASRIADYNALQPCLTQNLACVEDWAAARGKTFDYLYVFRGEVGQETIRAGDTLWAGWILNDLAANPGYQSVYESPLIRIFAKSPESKRP
jgi:hypothetical protein